MGSPLVAYRTRCLAITVEDCTVRHIDSPTANYAPANGSPFGWSYFYLCYTLDTKVKHSSPLVAIVPRARDRRNPNRLILRPRIISPSNATLCRLILRTVVDSSLLL